MFRIIKALNNNSILVLSNETKREYILMGSGIGFGKMPGQQIESIKGAKVYSLNDPAHNIFRNRCFIESTCKAL